MPMPMPDEPMIYTMQMTMTHGTDAKWLLFEDWRIKTGGELFGAMLFVTVLSLFIESMSFGMWMVQRRINHVDADMKSKSIPQQLCNSVIYFMLRLLNYSQMLIVMTYNIWLILSMAVASAFASFVFNAIKDGIILKDVERSKQNEPN